MEIRPLEQAVYAGRKFTVRYQTGGYYDLRPDEHGFRVQYTPFDAPEERSFPATPRTPPPADGAAAGAKNHFWYLHFLSCGAIMSAAMRHAETDRQTPGRYRRPFFPTAS